MINDITHPLCYTYINCVCAKYMCVIYYNIYGRVYVRIIYQTIKPPVINRQWKCGFSESGTRTRRCPFLHVVFVVCIFFLYVLFIVDEHNRSLNVW